MNSQQLLNGAHYLSPVGLWPDDDLTDGGHDVGSGISKIDLHIGLQSYLSEGKIKIQANGVSGGVENVESDFLLSSEGRML
jgi:hypothetical protein